MPQRNTPVILLEVGRGKKKSESADMQDGVSGDVCNTKYAGGGEDDMDASSPTNETVGCILLLYYSTMSTTRYC